MQVEAVIHIGNDPRAPGGISTVIRTHLQREALGMPRIWWCSYRPGASRLEQFSVFFSTAMRMFASREVTRSVVHVHMARRGSLLREGGLVLLARLRRCPRVIVTVHGSTSASAGVVGRLLLRLVVRPAHVVHLLSQEHRSLLRAGDQRVIILPNDVKVPRQVLPIASRRRLVLFLGEISHRKGVDVLLQAWAALPSCDWDLELFGEVIDATGGLLKALTPRSTYAGYINPHEVGEKLLRARILVLPSRAEALPMSVCEAMAAGCAVIATDVGGLPGLLDGPRRRQLIPQGKPELLAVALKQLMEDEPLAECLAAANRERARSFSFELLSQQWRSVYEGRQVAGGS